MTSFSRTWDASYEADPADGDVVSGGALDIRQVKEDVRERLEVDHSWAGNTDDGYHLQVTFVDPLSAKPTQTDDQTYLYTKDVSAKAELFFEDEDGDEVQLTAGGKVAGDNFAAGTAMLFYQDTAPTGWSIVVAVDNHVVELTDGSANGGATGGTVTGSVSTETFFARTATDSHTLTVAEMPAHEHAQFRAVVVPNGDVQGWSASLQNNGADREGSHDTETVGGGGGHTHNIDCQLQRAQVIVADKD